MPDLNDFYAFKSTIGGADGEGEGGGGGGGCLHQVLLAVLVIGILVMIGRCNG